MSKIELWVKQSKKYPTITSVVLNGYRVGGVKWNDIDDGDVVITNINKEDILIALGVDKQITELQQQLATQPREIVEKIKFKMDNVIGTLINLGNGKEDAVAWFLGILQEVQREYEENSDDKD